MWLFNVTKVIIYLIPVSIFFGYFSQHPEFRTEQSPEIFGEIAYNQTENPNFCQVANGVTSIAYLFAGIPSVLRLSCTNYISRNLELGYFVLACNYISIGNLCFHAFCLKNGLNFDGSGMTFLLAYIIGHTSKKLFLSRSIKVRNRIFWIFLITWIGITDPFMGHVAGAQTTYEIVIPTVVVVELTYGNAIEHRLLTNKYGIGSGVFMGLAYGMWRLQVYGKERDDTSWFQLHALWHTFSAISLCLTEEMYNYQCLPEIVHSGANVEDPMTSV